MHGSILITSVIGGMAAALWARDAGAPLALCILAYGICGAVSLTIAATLHLAFPAPRRPASIPTRGPQSDEPAFPVSGQPSRPPHH